MKSSVTEMMPLLKLSRKAMRTELCQKAIRFPDPRLAGVREKRFTVVWKRFVAEPLSDKLPYTCFQWASRRIAKNVYESEKRS